MVEKIMELCRAMGSGEEQDVLLLPLVEAAVVRLSARLKADVTPEDCGSAFLLAAAVEAMEGLERSSGGGVTSFTAGALTIRREGERPQEGMAERLLSPWLADSSFSFWGVRG